MAALTNYTTVYVTTTIPSTSRQYHRKIAGIPVEYELHMDTSTSADVGVSVTYYNGEVEPGEVEPTELIERDKRILEL